MASKSANINVNINSNFQQAEKSSEDMRKRIRELRKEFYSLEEGTEEYNKVLAELSKLQLDYSDQTIVMRNSANDLGQRLTNLVKVSGDLMSGFSAAQGVMGLLGIESDGFERTLIKLQSAMAIVQGLEGLEGMIDHMKALRASFSGITKPIASFIAAIGNWIKFGKTSVSTTRAQAAANTTLATTTTAATAATTGLATSMRVLRAALVSTGIGALVVLIGSAVGALSNWISKNNEAKRSQEEFNETLAHFDDLLANNTGAMRDAQREYEQAKGTYDELADLENQIAKADDTRAEINRTRYAKQQELDKEWLKKRKDDLKAEIAQLNERYEAANNAYNDAVYRKKTYLVNQEKLNEQELQQEKEKNTKQAELDRQEAQRDAAEKEAKLERYEAYLEQLEEYNERLIRTIGLGGADTQFGDTIDFLVEAQDKIRQFQFAQEITEGEAGIRELNTLTYTLNKLSRQFIKLADDIVKGSITAEEGIAKYHNAIDRLSELDFIKKNPVYTAMVENFAEATRALIYSADDMLPIIQQLHKQIAPLSEDFSKADMMMRSLGNNVAPSDIQNVKDIAYAYGEAAESMKKLIEQEGSTEERQKAYKDLLDQQEQYNKSAVQLEYERAMRFLEINEELYNQILSRFSSGNDAFSPLANSFLAATSIIQETLKDLGSSFANFWNAEKEEFDFSDAEWKDWATVATQALNGVGSILGQYAAGYKEQMEAVLESDEATQEQKEEAVKNYKNMMYAETAINMLAGIVSAWTGAMNLPAPANFIVGGIASALMSATGIMSLTQIAAIDPMSENSVSGTNPAGGTPNVSDVAINTDAYANQLSAQSSYDLQGALDERSSTDTRVYVLESDIAETSNDVNTKVSESTF